jgi:hypothetical protein
MTKLSGISMHKLLIVVFALTSTAAFAAEHNASRGLRFDSPGVLDLAERSQRPAGGSAAVTTLSAEDAKHILAAAALDEEHATLPFSEDLFGCKAEDNACVGEHERKLLAAPDAAAKRAGKQLTVTSASATPLVFIDWVMPETKNADGDSEAHWYLGALSGSSYPRVEVRFGHDSPGSFLINPKNGKVAFVHNGGDIVVPAPGGMHLLTFNTDNPPFSLRVGALDATGPRLELACEVAQHDEKTSAEFKGWNDADAFDLVIHVGGSAADKRGTALRIARQANHWAVAAADPAQLHAAGFTCAGS